MGRGLTVVLAQLPRTPKSQPFELAGCLLSCHRQSLSFFVVCVYFLFLAKVVPHQGRTPTNLLGPLREPLKPNFGITHNHLDQSTFDAKPTNCCVYFLTVSPGCIFCHFARIGHSSVSDFFLVPLPYYVLYIYL